MINRNELANLIIDYSHTAISKLTLFVGGSAAVSKTEVGSWLADLINYAMDAAISLTAWPWMEMVSNAAIFLLFVERAFIVWAWNKKRKRGEL
jgi:hypothetical protein